MFQIPPLGVAYLKGHNGCSDLLLSQPGVDVNFKDDSGATLLLNACKSIMTVDTLKQLKYLIKKGADVSAVDIRGRNAVRSNERMKWAQRVLNLLVFATFSRLC